jgi:hypothetical protein
MFSDPDLLKHGVKLLFDVNIILKSEFNLLFSFKNLMILVLEEDLTERIEFREKSDNILMVFELNFFEKKGSRLGKCFKKLRINCRIKRESKGNV